MRPAFHWLAEHIGLLALSLVLAAVVWISAVVTADPNEQATFRSVEVQVTGKNPDLLVVGELPHQARVTLQAPRSILAKLTNNPALLKAWIDLTGLGPGEHQVDLQVRIDTKPSRLLQLDPEQVSLALEPLLEKRLPVELALSGTLPLGYRRGQELLNPQEVTVSGPASAVQRVAQVRAGLDIAGQVETMRRQATLQVLDAEGEPVSGVNVSPREVTIEVPVSLLGGFRNAAVKVVTRGQVANGYRLTNILVSPPTVTLFSNNPQLIESLPGYVETLPVDLSNLVDDIELTIDLNLPDGITVVREPKVTVQVGVTALEGSVTLQAPVEVIGLTPGLQAQVGPTMVEVIVSGPLNLLENLTAANFRVILDVTGLAPGVYQRQVVVDQAPQGVSVDTTLPEIVDITISIAPPATVLPTETAGPSNP
ncbi:MAG: YbbR-like domain-containing protein [Chloroflexota bacterium]